MAHIRESSEKKVLPWLSEAILGAGGDGVRFLEALEAKERETEQMGIPCILLLGWMLMAPSGVLATLATPPETTE